MTLAKMMVVRHLFTILDPLAVLVGNVLAALGVSSLQNGNDIRLKKEKEKVGGKGMYEALQIQHSTQYTISVISHKRRVQESRKVRIYYCT